jgi:hypothetical protein
VIFAGRCPGRTGIFDFSHDIQSVGNCGFGPLSSLSDPLRGLTLRQWPSFR